MLQSISESIENIISILWGLISIVNVAGKTLAHLLKWFAITFIEFLSIVCDFFHLFYEDLKNFVDDINTHYIQTIKMFHHRLINICNDVISFIEMISECTMNGYQLTKASIKWFCMQWIDLIVNIILCTRTTFILIGNSTWMLIMFIPNLIILFVTSIFYAFNYLYQSILTITVSFGCYVQKFIEITINYITELPLRALLGFVIFGFIVKNRRTLFSIFNIIGRYFLSFILFGIEIFLYYADGLQNLFARFYNSLVNMLRIQNRRQHSSSSSSDESNEYHDECERNNVDINDRCVICRDRRKTILLMPCRHLCLCRRCATNLSNYRTVCPLCRKTYSNSIQIYT